MKIVRILVILILPLIIGVFLNSCCKRDYDSKWTYFISDVLDNDEITTKDTISHYAYGIRLEMFDRKFASNPNYSFINQAYASHCGEYFNSDIITNINIITLSEFNDGYEVFSDVSSHFAASLGGFSFDNDKKYSIDKLIEKINNNRDHILEKIDFQLYAIDMIDTTYQFVVEIELEDNRVLSDTTRIVRIY